MGEKVWFISDQHYEHENIITLCGRPFSSIQAHDKSLIERHNSVVRPKDTVYFLGDVGGKSPESLAKILAKLHGNICLITGNHDKYAIKDPARRRFGFIKDKHVRKVELEDGRSFEFYMCHYPHVVWPKMNRGTIMLYGHCHARLPGYGWRMDCGVDANNGFPFSPEEIVKRMEAVPMLKDFEIEELERIRLGVENKNMWIP